MKSGLGAKLGRRGRRAPDRVEQSGAHRGAWGRDRLRAHASAAGGCSAYVRALRRRDLAQTVTGFDGVRMATAATASRRKRAGILLASSPRAGGFVCDVWWLWLGHRGVRGLRVAMPSGRACASTLVVLLVVWAALGVAVAVGLTPGLLVGFAQRACSGRPGRRPGRPRSAPSRRVIGPMPARLCWSSSSTWALQSPSTGCSTWSRNWSVSLDRCLGRWCTCSGSG